MAAISGSKTKKAGTINKAQCIRDALTKLGIDTSAKKIQEECAQHKADVAPAQISNIRTKLKQGPAGKATKGHGSKRTCVDGPSVEEMAQILKLAQQMGGLRRVIAVAQSVQEAAK